MNNEEMILSSAAPWPNREPEPSFVERGRPPVYEHDPSKFDAALLQRQIERVEECRRQILDFENLIADWKSKIAVREDLIRQENEKIAKHEKVIAEQKALEPKPQKVSLSARAQLVDRIGHLYLQSAASGEDVTFSVLPSILDSVASDGGIVDNREFPNATNYCRGIFGRATLGIEFSFATLAERAKSLQGKSFNTRRIESGLI